MKRWLIGLYICAIAATATGVWHTPHRAPPIPEPTEQGPGESGDFAQRRAQWIEHMHRHAPGLDWRAQDAATLARLDAQRAARMSARRQGQTVPALANVPAGTWIERGARNQAGRVSAVDFDAATDRLTVFAHGGQLWRSTRSALDWQPLNDTRHFEPYYSMQHFARLSGTTERWIVADDTQHGFFYSDDQGTTWTPAGGYAPGNWLQTSYLVARDIAGSQVYALVEDYNFTANAYQARLLVSDDRGTSFSDLGFVGTEEQTALFAPDQGSNLVYLLEDAALKRIETGNSLTSVATIAGTPVQGTDDKVGLAGGITSGATPTPFLYAFYEAGGQTSVFQSLNAGSTWTARGSMPATANIRMAVGTALHDPNYVFFGGVDLWRSTDGGQTFGSNNWADYYGDPLHNLHADISFVQSFPDTNGNDVFLIGTDGGLYQSTDDGATVTNLNPVGMRQAQYYDSYTARTPPYVISIGAQDQGYQRNSDPPSGTAGYDQVISGDYAHLTSSDGGATVWSNYAGFTQVDPNPADPSSTVLPEWDFASDGNLQNMLFLPPLLADPSNPHVAWLAGGSATVGVNHIIQLTWNGNVAWTGAIAGSEGSYDFRGQITALASNGSDYFALADDSGGGTNFFRSTTPLASWTAGATSLPQGQFFYGNGIATAGGKIYFCGSGYSGPGVYVSTDNGSNFTAMNAGLPSTFVYALAISPDGSKLFAATEVGPFYYDQAGATWVDIGSGAPDNIYWSVDYIPALNVARFSTYGRGLWDYDMGGGDLIFRSRFE